MADASIEAFSREFYGKVRGLPIKYDKRLSADAIEAVARPRRAAAAAALPVTLKALHKREGSAAPSERVVNLCRAEGAASNWARLLGGAASLLACPEEGVVVLREGSVVAPAALDAILANVSVPLYVFEKGRPEPSSPLAGAASKDATSRDATSEDAALIEEVGALLRRRGVPHAASILAKFSDACREARTL